MTTQTETISPPPILDASAASQTAGLVPFAATQILQPMPAAGNSGPSTLDPRLSTCRSRPRLGKVARLPKPQRDLVNRMLRNGLPYHKIVGALDELGVQVTERNISNWKTCGGYREWCLAHDHALNLHLHQDNMAAFLRRRDATDAPEVGLQISATRLSEFFLTPQAAELLASNPDEYHHRAAQLARLTAQLHQLQKYRNDSAAKAGSKYDPVLDRLESEEDLESVRKAYSSAHGQKSSDPSIPHRNFLPASYE